MVWIIIESSEFKVSQFLQFLLHDIVLVPCRSVHSAMRSGPGLLTILRIATAEWVSLRSNMINNQGNFGANVRETLQHLHSSKIYPNLAKIASATLVIPVSTAGEY